jgi:multidrug resistance efflux pump
MNGADMQEAARAEQLAVVLDLLRAARQAQGRPELDFLLVNDTRSLLSYRQAALWTADKGVTTLSGLLLPDRNAPYAQWLTALCRALAARGCETIELTAADLPPALSADWAEWWPSHALWIPVPGTGDSPAAALLLAGDDAWREPERVLAREWVEGWWQVAERLAPRSRRRWRGSANGGQQPSSLLRRYGHWLLLAAVAASLCLPVPLSVIAPAELVPAHPTIVRAPLDGVVDVFHVRPNEAVRKQQPLFGFDEALIDSKLRVAQQALATAETEYRQTLQQALGDSRYRTQLSTFMGRIEERKAEVAYLSDQQQRAKVLAPIDGVALFDDPNDWIGKPVTVGERILRIAASGDVEVEAWLSVGDAMALAPGAPVTIYLNTDPLRPLSARLRLMAHDAVQRPDGTHAYRVRATLDTPTAQRVGLKGTARLTGERVPLVYLVMRRPLAWLRTTLGV